MEIHIVVVVGVVDRIRKFVFAALMEDEIAFRQSILDQS
jgi:hypothetical protein